MTEGEEPLLVDFVMSSLNISSIGVSRSSRPIVAITMPPYLSSRLVLDKWVKTYIHDISFPDEMSELKLLSLIACFPLFSAPFS